MGRPPSDRIHGLQASSMAHALMMGCKGRKREHKPGDRSLISGHLLSKLEAELDHGMITKPLITSPLSTEGKSASGLKESQHPRGHRSVDPVNASKSGVSSREVCGQGLLNFSKSLQNRPQTSFMNTHLLWRLTWGTSSAGREQAEGGLPRSKKVEVPTNHHGNMSGVRVARGDVCIEKLNKSVNVSLGDPKVVNVVEDELGLSRGKSETHSPTINDGLRSAALKISGKVLSDKSDQTPSGSVKPRGSKNPELARVMEQEIPYLSVIPMNLLQEGNGGAEQVLPEKADLAGTHPMISMA